MKRWIARVGIAIIGILFLAAAGFVVWASNPLGPSGQALDVLSGANGPVEIVEDANWIDFHPAGGDATTGLIFYPGGRVDYRSYAPLMEQVAEAGYQVVLMRMPLNLAVFGVERATDAMQAFPQVQNWAVGGHSLGGAMAAAYAYRQPGAVDGLVLWAAYPAENNSLAGQDLSVVSVYGSEDGLATPDKIDASRPLLPEDTRWVEIPGGIHSYFGSYGLQPGDGQTQIAAVSQWQQTAGATVELLAEIGGQ